MVFKSRFQIPIPHCSLATLMFKSPTEPLSDKIAFADASKPDTHYLTRPQFRLWCQRVAAGLRKAGLKDGDRVLLFSGNDIFFPVVFLGITMAGGVFTGANPTYVARELAYQLQNSGAVFLLCSDAGLATGLEAAQEAKFPKENVFVFNSGVLEGKTDDVEGCKHWSHLVASEEEGRYFEWAHLNTPEESSKTIALNYSSGTTGVPKGVEISHRNYVANCVQYNFFETRYDDIEERLQTARSLCYLPMYHAMAQTIYIACGVVLEMPCYIMPKFDFVQMLENVQRFRITQLGCVPPIAVALAKNPIVRKYDLSSVRLVGSGAAPLSGEIMVEVESLWPNGSVRVKQGWGMTELTCSATGWDPKVEIVPASIGEIVPNCEAKIVDEDGNELGVHQRGEMLFRGPTVMKGYWKNPKATQETITEDGFVRTGDICYADEKGFFYVVDRKKELIKVKGNQVAPAELEGLLLEHAAVADAAVIGASINGEEYPRAYIVLQQTHQPSKAMASEIISYMDNRVARIKRITGGVMFVDAIPKNPSGKILRKFLREKCQRELEKEEWAQAKL